MTCKHYTPDEEKYILSARRAGVSFEQIAKTLKRNKTALYQKFYDLGKKHGLFYSRRESRTYLGISNPRKDLGGL